MSTTTTTVTATTITKPMKAIRAKCLECCCGKMADVRRCSITDCALHPFRMGKNPNRAGIGGNPQLTGRFCASNTKKVSEAHPKLDASQGRE